jgi:Ubiquitin fold domain
MKISDLVEMIGKKKLAPDVKHLVVEMLVSDAEGEDIDVSARYSGLPLTQSWISRSHIPWCTSKAPLLEKEMYIFSMSLRCTNSPINLRSKNDFLSKP